MAFNFIYLAKLQPTQTYDAGHTANSSLPAGGCINCWTYNGSVTTGSNEAAATIEAANYFLPALGYLKVGDIIFIASNDGGAANHMLSVTVNNGTTTLTTVQTV